MKAQTKKVQKRAAYLLLHDIRSALNVGAIFRTADAAGVSKIFLSGTTAQPIDRFGRPVPQIAKTALGAEKTLAWEYISRPAVAIARCRNEKAQIIAIEQNRLSVDYKKVRLAKKPALFVVGNEVTGLPQSILQQCDVVAEIPMRGEKESLNVSVALGVALFRIRGI